MAKTSTIQARIDPDVWFWHKWREAGNTVYIHPKVMVGHMEEVASYFTPDYEPKLCTTEQYKQMRAGHDIGQTFDAIEAREKKTNENPVEERLA